MPFLSMAPRRAVIVAPHADDEVLGAGGLALLAARRGWEVHVLFATVSGYPSTPRGEISGTALRAREVERAAAALGLAGYSVLFEGEERHLALDAVPQSTLIRFVEEHVGRIRPSLAVVPGRGHHHQDHRAVADACVAALRPAPDGRAPFVPAVLAYGHAAAGWGGEAFAFRPDVFVDIGAVVEDKLAALACYESQVCDPPHPRSLPAVRHQHAAWGALAGVSHAEPFECLRLVQR